MCCVYFLLSSSCFSNCLASSAVLTRISMHTGFTSFCLLSIGGLGTQLSETLLLPCRLVGMLFVREMFRRMLPVNTHSTTLDVSDQWHIQEGLILCMKSASVITKIHRKCCKSTSFRINKEWNSAHNINFCSLWSLDYGLTQSLLTSPSVECCIRHSYWHDVLVNSCTTAAV